ncbi:hypothetical protein ES708_18864 [subsurface metagenome]
MTILPPSRSSNPIRSADPAAPGAGFVSAETQCMHEAILDESRRWMVDDIPIVFGKIDPLPYFGIPLLLGPSPDCFKDTLPVFRIEHQVLDCQAVPDLHLFYQRTSSSQGEEKQLSRPLPGGSGSGRVRLSTSAIAADALQPSSGHSQAGHGARLNRVSLEVGSPSHRISG